MPDTVIVHVQKCQRHFFFLALKDRDDFCIKFSLHIDILACASVVEGELAVVGYYTYRVLKTRFCIQF
jgi:hypothetical protein